MKALAISIKRFVQSELEKAKEALSYSSSRIFANPLSPLLPIFFIQKTDFGPLTVSTAA